MWKIANFIKSHIKLTIFLVIIIAISSCVITKQVKQKIRHDLVLEQREKLEKDVAAPLAKAIEGYEDASGVSVTAEFTEDNRKLAKKGYGYWYDRLTITVTPPSGYDKLTRQEKYDYMRDISDETIKRYKEVVEDIAPEYYQDILAYSGIHDNYECYDLISADVYCVTAKHTYYYENYVNLASIQLDIYDYYKDGEGVYVPTPVSGSSQSKSSSSKKSNSRYSGGSSYSFDPADYDDPDEFAEDAEDEYGSYDAAYDAWEDY